MTRDEIIARIRKCHNLPSLPFVAMQVLEMVRTDSADIREIAALISNDPALSGKLIKTVNSPFYGLPKPVASIPQALVILGTEAVKTLVLGFSLVGSLSSDDQRGETQVAYWRRSVYSAVAARLLCQRLRGIERDVVFLAALLKDVGIQVLKQVGPHEYDRLLATTAVWNGRLARTERAALGICHCEAGDLLAEQWRLPPTLRMAIVNHHHCRSAKPEHRRFCRVVELANLCAEVFMGHKDGRFVARVHRYARVAFKLDPQTCDALLAEVGTNTQALAELFELNIGQQQSYEDILAEASQTLQDLSLRSQMQARKLQAEAHTDGLTGVANRRRLDQCLSDEFKQARKLIRPLSLVFIDVDRFKGVNDAHGHAVGDQVLRHLARLFTDSIRPGDTVGRYGGEEFVVLLPRTPLAAAARIAEGLRKRVESSPMQLNGGPLSLTISAGVAGFDGAGGPFKAADHLAQAADRAAYAAKQAGRNTVRVFSLKTPKPAAAP